MTNRNAGCDRCGTFDRIEGSNLCAACAKEERVCGWCGGRYVPGFWPWHAAWGHRSGPYTQSAAALDRWMAARGLVMP